MTTKGHNVSDPCGICAAFGLYIPWSMIVIGGIVGAIPLLEPFNETSSYMVAFGIILLAGSALLNHLQKIRIPRL